MVSHLVMTEHHCRGKQDAPKPIGLASYGIDIHEVRRIAHNGLVVREELALATRGPRAPTRSEQTARSAPKASEAVRGAAVSFCLSASHIAFSSISMEPVFMILNQLAATAACLAIDRQVTVQNVHYPARRVRLIADDQILSLRNFDIHSSIPVGSESSRRCGQRCDQVRPGGRRRHARRRRLRRSGARDGLPVLLVHHNRHLGGTLTNGLCQWDALYGGPRAPLFNEYACSLDQHYRTTYGEIYTHYRCAGFTIAKQPLGTFEPSVAQRKINQLVAGESRITILLGFYPSAVDR